MRVFVVSLAVHAAAFALLMRMPRPAPRVDAPAERESIEIVEDEPPSAPVFVAPLPNAPGTRDGPARIAALSRGTSSVGPTEIAPASGGLAPGPTAPEPSGSGALTWSLPMTTKALGIGRENPFLPTSPPPAASTNPDLGLRFGPSSEGPALTALREATSSSLAPLNGRARFTVRANAEGEVLGIDLDDATGGTGWDDARRLALEGLRGKKLVVPRGARGINVRFEIVSELSFPSGQKSPAEFSFRGGAVVLPDESNIGQRPTRKVHAHHLGTEVL